MAKKKNTISPQKIPLLSIDAIRSHSERGLYFNLRSLYSKQINEISILRESIEPAYYKNVIELLYKKPLSTKLLGKYRTLSELNEKKLSFTDVGKELLWAKLIIFHNSPHINVFVGLSEDYSMNYLLGNYNLCYSILDAVEKEFGYSLWLIKNKISLIQITKGLEEQKKYAQFLRKGLKNGSLPSFVAYWTSVRNEDKTTANRFESQIESISNKLDPETQLGFNHFINYHLLGLTSPKIEDFIHVLRISYSISLIDYYEAFVYLINNALLDDSNQIRAVHLEEFLNTMKFDSRILFLNRVIKKNTEGLVKIASDLYDSILTFENSNYENNLAPKTLEYSCINIILSSHVKAFWEDKDDDIEKKEAIKDSNITKDAVIYNLSQIIKKGKNNSPKEYNELKKILLNCGTHSWSQSIKLVLSQEKDVTKLISGDDFFSVLCSSTVHPYFLWFANNSSISSNYKFIVQQLYAETISYDLHRALNELSVLSIPPNDNSFFFHYAKSLICYKNKEYDEAINYADKIKNSQYDYFERRGYGILAYSYLQKNDYISSCKIMSENLISGKNHIDFLPLKEFSDIIESGTGNWENTCHLIDFSIVMDWAFRTVNPAIEMKRRFAYEDFLIKNNVDKPSKLRAIVSEIDIKKLIYYLRYICLESIMETSSFFEGGSKEVLDERLAVCRLLLEIDKNNDNVYKLEIKDILRRQIISNRRQEVDKSRIYVDIHSIKEWAVAELSESFNRYLSYVEIDLINKDKNQTNKISTVGEELSVKNDINVPIDEAFSLFRYIFEEVRKMYLSVEMGLDRFISTRIRHGELERTMRIPIQKHKLITKRSSKNGPYKSNSFWIDKYISITQNASEISDVFDEFSRKYDDLIFNIANEYLQIKKSNKQNGLFDFDFYEEEIKHIVNSINRDTTFDECLNSIINLLESRLILSLVNIRAYINNICKQNAKKLLNTLNDDINVCLNTSLVEFETALVSARTDLSLQFDKIIEWFVPPTSGSSTPFKIEDALVVAEEIIKEDSSGFKVNYPSNESSFQIHGQLPIFVDVFINIFDNVVKRSGLDQPQAIVNITEEDSEVESKAYEEVVYIKIEVSNNIGEEIDKEKLTENLKAKKELLNSGNYTEYLAREGNSGLFKIHKSVTDFNVDGKYRGALDFGVREQIFYIEMQVPFKIIHLETDEKI